MAKITKMKSSVTSATLELSIEEITFLKDVLNNVGGSPTYSRRGIGDAIMQALSGVLDTYPRGKTPDIDGEITFRDTPREKPSNLRGTMVDIDEEVPF